MIVMTVEMPRLFAEGEGMLRTQLTIPTGSLTALVGPSGSGKTTLLRLLAGLETPTHGRIVVNESVWLDCQQRINWKPQQRSVGYVFQDAALFPNMTVLESIQFAAPVGQQKRVDQLIAETGLRPFLHQKPLRLSGGQRQRVALVRALVRRPQVLLLDEPFAALDATASQSLQQTVKTLHQEWGTTTLLVSHHEADVRALADRVVQLVQGQLVADRPADKMASPMTEQIQHIQYNAAQQQWIIQTESTRIESSNPAWSGRRIGDWITVS